MTTLGDISRGDPVSVIIDQHLPKRALVVTSGIATPKVALAVEIEVDYIADAAVHSLQNPFDRDCYVEAIVEVITVDATETIDIGVDSDGTSTNDTIVDGLAVATAGVFSSLDDPGSNGGIAKLDKNGGASDFLVWTLSAGSDTGVGKIKFIFHPIGTS